MSILGKKEEFSWKLIAASFLWSIVLFPGMLVGPIRISFAGYPFLVDPIYLLEILGGILFGVWGGMISPALAVTICYVIKGDVPREVFLLALVLHLVNATVIPHIRYRVLSTARHLDFQPVLVYILSAVLLVPLLNGAFYAFFLKYYFLEAVAVPYWKMVCSLGFFFALLLLFPGELLFRIVVPEAKRMGLFLENRWSLWSVRSARYRSHLGILPAILLCLAPLPLLALLIQGSLRHEQEIFRDNFLVTRLHWLRSVGSTLDDFLRRKNETLDMSARLVHMSLGSPENINSFLLNILKSDPDILNLEYIDSTGSESRIRLRFFVPDEGELESLKDRTNYYSPLRQSPDGTWTFAWGRQIADRDGAIKGWLFLRCQGGKLIRTITDFQKENRPGQKLLLADQNGQFFFGHNPLPAFDRTRSIQFVTDGGGKHFLLLRYPLLAGIWDMVFLEEYQFIIGMRELMAAANLWACVIHLGMLALTVGLTLLARVIP